jgi:hypothetical protein
LLQRESFFDKKNRICCESIYFESDRSYLNGEVQSFCFEESGVSPDEKIFTTRDENILIDEFALFQLLFSSQEIIFIYSPHTLHPTPHTKRFLGTNLAKNTPTQSVNPITLKSKAGYCV